VGIAHIQPITKIMEININTIDSLQIVTLDGEIDSSVASEVTEKIVPLVTEKAKIILDMTAVAYMSSAGLRTLLSIHRQASNSDVPLILVGLSEEIKYDLILLDLLMPEIDGYQVLENIKQNEKKKHIPVIMISALDDMENVIRCIEIGAEDYLPKPFNKTLLRARIGACLEKKILRDREIEYLKKLNQELDKGREMQLNFLPAKPLQIPNWEIASFFKPARQVAGDFYDTFKLANNDIVLVNTIKDNVLEHIGMADQFENIILFLLNDLE
jgi:anti-anti-sigma factor